MLPSKRSVDFTAFTFTAQIWILAQVLHSLFPNFPSFLDFLDQIKEAEEKEPL